MKNPRSKTSNVKEYSRTIAFGITFAVAVTALLAQPSLAQPGFFPWRSDLYPTNWTPGYTNGQGRSLPDFSYAGYHKGEDPIPTSVPGPVVNVTQAPYFADKFGNADATTAIQNAINYVQNQGGGTVFLPAGTYRVSPQGSNVYALWIKKSNVVLRGGGPDNTFIYNDSQSMRNKSVIRVSPFPANDLMYSWDGSNPISLAQDLQGPTTMIQLQSVDGLNVGDWVMIRQDVTPQWIADHLMTGSWSLNIDEPTMYRQITAINQSLKRIHIDIPTRNPMLRRDNARVDRMVAHLSEVGLENFSIGMRQKTGSGFGSNDYNNSSKAAYHVHLSMGIKLNHLVDGWVSNVRTYRPASNSSDIHVLSGTLLLRSTRNVTVRDCIFARPQYRGAGGNGYHVTIQGQENLITNCSADRGRHNYSFGLAFTSGNVLHESTASNGDFPVDFHMQLSTANLIDSMTLVWDHIQAWDRGCCGHGISSTQAVIWNTKGQLGSSRQNAVFTGQWGWGYVIGTSGRMYHVYNVSHQNYAPDDWVEGVIYGAFLEPQSLYLDQLQRRN